MRVCAIHVHTCYSVLMYAHWLWMYFMYVHVIVYLYMYIGYGCMCFMYIHVIVYLYVHCRHIDCVLYVCTCVL